ncbi:MAG: carbohydrate-binding domain-containing protein [Bacilli bacterium]|nr:carbohydrate-binding domain-containing protein [Bacilli bacterium]
MKKIIRFSLILLIYLSFTIIVKAENTIIINLDKLEINNTQKIKEYQSYNDFINDYKTNKLPNVYLTNFLFDGVSIVKDYDLDDFIKNNSNDIEIKELKVKVININDIGNYELKGNYNGMIGVNTNNKKGEINIILNNVNIDSDTKKAPALYVYNKDKNYSNCKVTIKTIKGTNNILVGGRLKKVSLIPIEELDKYEDYYSKKRFTNYKQYSNYYGVYTKKEINNLLFASVEADKEGLKDGDPYYFYKASGVISSDIDISFKGEGYLKVESKNNEGIESKGNLSFDGGTGDYEIISFEDTLNTTTVDGNNDLIIDVNSLVARINKEANGGDAIDSNGKLIINGGNVYAFAHPTSNDTGLDSVMGIYLNNGTVIATGNKEDKIIDESKQNYLYITLNDEIEEDTLIVIKDENDKVLMAYKTDRSFKNLLYTSPNLNYKAYKLYVGGDIIGKETNGLYDEIEDYKGGTLIYSSDNNDHPINDNTDSMILIYIGVLVIVLLGFIISSYRKAKKEEDDK